MSDCMAFPETFDEFVESFGFVDSKEYYTNGSELIQVFRVKQWLEHEFNRLEEENANYSRNNRSLTEAVTEMQTALKKQSAEIERLEKQLNSKYKWENMLDKKIKEVKSEAIKEFAERLKEECAKDGAFGYIDAHGIDNLVKEMVGDAE